MLRKRSTRKRQRIRSRDGKLNVIGPRIRELRRTLVPRVSQEDLAGRLAGQGIQVDRTAINKIERRERMVSDIEIAALARCLKTSVEKLFAAPESRKP